MSKEEHKRKLHDLRKEVDAIDRKLVELLDQRSGMSLLIGRIKKESGQELYSPDREEEIFRNILNIDLNNISAVSLKRIFSAIVEESLAIQESVKRKDD